MKRIALFFALALTLLCLTACGGSEEGLTAEQFNEAVSAGALNNLTLTVSSSAPGGEASSDSRAYFADDGIYWTNLDGQTEQPYMIDLFREFVCYEYVYISDQEAAEHYNENYMRPVSGEYVAGWNYIGSSHYSTPGEYLVDNEWYGEFSDYKYDRASGSYINKKAEKLDFVDDSVVTYRQLFFKDGRIEKFISDVTYNLSTDSPDSYHFEETYSEYGSTSFDLPEGIEPQ